MITPSEEINTRLMSMQKELVLIKAQYSNAGERMSGLETGQDKVLAAIEGIKKAMKALSVRTSDQASENPIINLPKQESTAAELATQKREKARLMAVELGKRFEECLIGDPNPSQGKVDAVSAALTVGRTAIMKEFGHNPADGDTMEKMAVEGVVTAILLQSKNKVRRWRIEGKAERCASTMLELKRGGYYDAYDRNRVCRQAYYDLEEFVKLYMPGEYALGMSFGREIMNKAYEEVQAFSRAEK